MSNTCSICLEESEELIIVKPCKHEFHLYCLKEIIRPFCPMCKCDISNFLTANKILTDKEIDDRIEKDDDRIDDEMLNQVIDDDDNNEYEASDEGSQKEDNHTESSESDEECDDDEITAIINSINHLTNEEIIERCVETSRTNNTYSHVCTYILCMKIKINYHMFATISNIHARYDRAGIFLYKYDSYAQFIKQQINDEPSIAKFINLNELYIIIYNNDQLEKILYAFNKINQSDVFVVFMIDNQIVLMLTPNMLSSDSQIYSEFEYNEIVASLISGNILTSKITSYKQNAEFIWSHEYLQQLRI